MSSKAHSFSKPRKMPWAFCQSCGLVRLRNAASESAERKTCPGERANSGFETLYSDKDFRSKWGT